MIEGIEKGDEFLCFKTTYYAGGFRDNDIIFKSGKIYKSYRDRSIEDEQGNICHTFTYDFWTQYLVKLNDKKIDMSHIKDIPMGDKIMIVNQLKKYNKKFK